MKKENTNLPLWKVLNEQRTRGKFTISPISGDISIGEELAGFISTGKIDAQYTTLAVNNFAAVVEALEDLINKATETTANLCGFDGADILDGSIDKAKEALNRIK